EITACIDDVQRCEQAVDPEIRVVGAHISSDNAHRVVVAGPCVTGAETGAIPNRPERDIFGCIALLSITVTGNAAPSNSPNRAICSSRGQVHIWPSSL